MSLENPLRDRGTTMSSEESPNGSVWSAATVLLLLAVLALAMAGMWVSSIPVLGLSALMGSVLLPRNALPSTALWMAILLPLNFTGVPKVAGAFFTPAVIVVAVWLVRVAIAERATTLRVVRGWSIVVPLVVLLGISALVNMGGTQSSIVIPMEGGRSFAWISVLLVCGVAPAMLGQTSRDDVWSPIQSTFAGIGVFLGSLALLEFVFNVNPWFSLYEQYIQQTVWSVFRAMTSMGHPLVTSTIASVALSVCLFPSGEVRRSWYWFGAGGALVALVLSVSRSGVYAIGLAGLVGILAARSKSKHVLSKDKVGLLLLGAIPFGAVAFSPLLTQRSASSEGADSANYRFDMTEKALRLITERPWLGYGPGTSNWVYTETYMGLHSGVARLENSLLQGFVSTGIPAAVLMFAGVIFVVWLAVRRARPSVAAGITAFFVSIAGYNALEADTALLAIIAPLIFLAVMPTDEGAETSDLRSPGTPKPKSQRTPELGHLS